MLKLNSTELARFQLSVWIFPFVLFIKLFTIGVLAQDGNPYITHYWLPDGMSSQNWDFELGENGQLYILNRKGIFSYDGLQWDNLGVYGRPIAIAYSKKLFFSTDRGVGFFQRNQDGTYTQEMLIEAHKNNYFFKLSHIPNGLLVISPNTICRIITEPSINIDTLYYDNRPEVFISDFFELNETSCHVKNRALLYLNKPDGGGLRC